MNPSVETLCRLVDTSVPYPNWYVEVPVSSLEQLEQMLRGFATGEPRILELLLPERRMMSVGIGGDLAAVTVYPIRNPTPGEYYSWTAQARRRYADEPREFIRCNLAQEFAASALMPVEEVIGLVLYYVGHLEVPDTHVWLTYHGAPYPKVAADMRGS
jgi:hypothetical protein